MRAPTLLARKPLIHFQKNTDGSTLISQIGAEKDNDWGGELRISYFPSSVVVGIDPLEDDLNMHYKANMKDVFDPTQVQREWIPVWLVKYGAPRAYQNWEDAVARSKRVKKRTLDSAPEDLGGTSQKRPRGRPRKSDKAAEAGPQIVSRPQITSTPQITATPHRTTIITVPQQQTGPVDVIDLTEDD